MASSVSEAALALESLKAVLAAAFIGFALSTTSVYLLFMQTHRSNVIRSGFTELHASSYFCITGIIFTIILS